MDRLPTMAALKNRNVSFDRVGYVSCDATKETLEHILCSCDLAMAVWYKIGVWCKVRPIFFFSVKDIFEIEEHLGLRGNTKEVFKGIVFVTCWCLCRARNNKRFNNEETNGDKVFQEIKATSFFWYKNRSRCCTISLDSWNRFEVVNNVAM
uniref:uncharacterized protein LOC122604635 n=1 Tax=Erigeron canadensis TaxID=72917 RepID=UPI001CB893A9|nr:uncharacterized protein LOC122604635 [Erigeron canadensis]